MSRALDELLVAEKLSNEARARLTGTLISLQKRLTPKALIREATDELKEKAAIWSHEAIEAIRERPATTAGFVVGVLALLFRDSLWKALGALFRHETETDDEELNHRMIGEGTG